MVMRGYAIIILVDVRILFVLQAFFENMRKSLKTIFLFMYYWRKKNIKEDIGREIRINKNTMTEWSYLLREVFQAMFLFADIKLGGVNEKGVPRVVEIDEFLFFKRKYHRGRYRNQQWISGMGERGTKKANFFIVTVGLGRHWNP
jgi:hypothetical protein